MGLEGFLWVRIMEDKISEHSTIVCLFCWEDACQQHTTVYDILWRVQEDEKRARIVNPAEKKSGM